MRHVNKNMEYIGIVEIISKINIDERIKPLIAAYFAGKIQLSGLFDEKKVEKEIKNLCDRIKNIEFVENPNMTVVYEKTASILSINKTFFKEGKLEDCIALIFAKFEEASRDDKNEKYDHIEDFTKGVEIAKILGFPINSKHQATYSIIKNCFENNKEEIVELLQNDRDFQIVARDFNEALNKMIITGKFNKIAMADMLRFLHYTLDVEASNNGKSIKTEENRKIVQDVLEALETLPDAEKSVGEMKIYEYNYLVESLKEMTGYVEKNQSTKKIEDTEIANSLKSKIEKKVDSNVPELTEEYIILRVNQVIEKKKNWDSRISKALIPFFIRSAKIYNWNFDEFNERLNQIDLFIEEIAFSDELKLESMGNTGLNKILLNSRIYLDKTGNLKRIPWATMFHELGHNTDMTTRGNIEIRKRAGESLSGYYYESVHSVFELAMMNRMYKDEDAMLLSNSSYDYLKNLNSVFASALGVSELEIVKSKDKGINGINELFKSKLPEIKEIENEYTGEKILEPVEKLNNYFSRIELIYGLELGKRRSNQELIEELYSYAIDIMTKRIEAEISSGQIDDIESYKLRQGYMLKKINVNIIESQKKNGQRFKKIKLVHNIGDITDDISHEQIRIIGSQFIREADFGFDNSKLEEYETPNQSAKKSFWEKYKIKKQIRLPEPKEIAKESDEIKEKREER